MLRFSQVRGASDSSLGEDGPSTSVSLKSLFSRVRIARGFVGEAQRRATYGPNRVSPDVAEVACLAMEQHRQEAGTASRTVRILEPDEPEPDEGNVRNPNPACAITPQPEPGEQASGVDARGSGQQGSLNPATQSGDLVWPVLGSEERATSFCGMHRSSPAAGRGEARSFTSCGSAPLPRMMLPKAARRCGEERSVLLCPECSVLNVDSNWSSVIGRARRC